MEEHRPETPNGALVNAASSEYRAMRRPGITIGTILLLVAAAGALSGLANLLNKRYAAIPPTSSALLPKADAIAALFACVVLPAFAFLAWRNASLNRLAAQITITATLVLSCGWFENANLSETAMIPLLLAALVVIPLTVRRAANQTTVSQGVLRKVDYLAWLLVDSYFGFLFTYFVVYKDYLPK